MENFAERFVDRMLQSGVIGEEEKELYQYAFVVKTEQYLTFVVLFFMAWIFGKVLPTLMFLLCFYPIRRRSGGYHMKNFFGCFIGTIVIYALWVKIMEPLMILHEPLLYIIFAISFILLEAIGAINHPNMDWSGEEYRASKKMVREVVFFELAVVIVTGLLGAEIEYVAYMMFGMILSAFLLVLAKVMRQEV